MMQALSSPKQHQLDHTVPPLELSTETELRGLRVGVVSEYPFFRPSAEIIKGLSEPLRP